MITLSDTSVKAAGKHLHGRYYTANRDLYWDRLSENEKLDFQDTARAAIIAYLEAEIAAGRAKESAAFYYGSTWVADTSRPLRPIPMDFHALILSLEPSK